MNAIEKVRGNSSPVVIEASKQGRVSLFVSDILRGLRERRKMRVLCRNNQGVTSLVIAEQLAVTGDAFRKDLNWCFARVLMSCAATGKAAITQRECETLIRDSVMKRRYLTAFGKDTVRSLQFLLTRIEFKCSWDLHNDEEVFYLEQIRRLK